MSKKIDARFPEDMGKKVMKSYAGIRSPWGKIINQEEANRWVTRYTALISAACNSATRIMVPDYATRVQMQCEATYQKLYNSELFMSKMPFDPDDPMCASTVKGLNIHPFCRGSFAGALSGDAGDESLMMPGRVNDFGTYRCEKELDVCEWDIVGSEPCRISTMSLQAGADAKNEHSMSHKGPKLDYHMVEAIGCGDRHCRIVAEDRGKYPMPDHPMWECMGPIATDDQIQYTEEEDCVYHARFFREDADFIYHSGTHIVRDSKYCYQTTTLACLDILPAVDNFIEKGFVTKEQATYILEQCCEAAGKAYLANRVGASAHKRWMGVPEGVHDCRILGADIEMYLQAMGIYDYKIEAFNSEEVILDIDRTALSCYEKWWLVALLAFWRGMARTFISTWWFAWEEPEEGKEDRVRLKIAHKIDKFC